MSPEKKKTNQHDPNGISGRGSVPRGSRGPDHHHRTASELRSRKPKRKSEIRPGRPRPAWHSECVSITDMEDIVLFVNEAFCTTYGFQEEELLGKPIDIIRSPNNPPEVGMAILPATLQGGWQGEISQFTQGWQRIPRRPVYLGRAH